MKDGSTNIEIPIELYKKLKTIAKDHGVTVDQFTEIYFTGHHMGMKYAEEFYRK